jgi:DNA-binding beta-propeller fold protein YncE
MKNIHKNEQGGAHVLGILLIVIVFGAISFVGYRVWKTKQEKPVQSNAQTDDKTTKKPSGNYEGDLTSKIKLEQIKLTGKGNQGIAVDKDTGLVYIGTFGGLNNKCLVGNANAPERSYLNIVDPKQAKEVAGVLTDPSPIWPAVDKQRDVVYVAASSGSVAIHKRGTGEKVGSIKLGGLPHLPALLGNIMVVSNTYDQSQTYFSAVNLDTRKVVGNHKGPRLPHPIVVDEKAKLAYMMGVESAEVGVIDMNTGGLKETFKFDGGAGQLEISTKYKKAITDSNQGGSSVAVFDLDSKKLLDRISFEGANTPGTGLAIDEEAGLIFVVVSDQGAIGVATLDTHKPLGFFKVGACPYAVKLDTQRGKGYVTNTGDGTLSVFDLNKLKETLGY